jgi:hypothetical protein
MTEMPDFIRRAIEAQGKVDPDTVLAAVVGADPVPPDEVEVMVEQDWRHALPDSPPAQGDVPPVVPAPTLLDDVDADRAGKAQRPGDAAETQRLAALRVMPHTGTARRKVLDAIMVASFQGMTDEEIQDVLHMNPSTQRPRRVELVEGGWVEDSGERRPTRSGMDAVVWRGTDKALA